MHHRRAKLALVLCLALFAGLLSACGGPSSTPTLTLTAYCNALKSSDYQTAYNQFGTGGPAGVSEAQYAAIFKAYGKVTDCSLSNVNDSAGTGLLQMTFANLGNVDYDTTLVNQNGAWKIKTQTARSTPTFVLNVLCVSLANDDYQSAYHQFSSNLQSQLTQDQFASLVTQNGARSVTDCTTSNVDDSAGSGTVTVTASTGTVSSQDFTLTQENGAWKISSFTSTATETLNSFCSALKSQDYQSAFGDLSSAQQGQVGSANQLASAFSSNKVTDCSVSNGNDSAGTGTISYNYADGSTQAFNYTLVNESNYWLIDSAQQAQ